MPMFGSRSFFPWPSTFPVRLVRHLSTLFLPFLISTISYGQMTVTGTVSGTVTDPSGQIVPAANVTLTSEKTGENRSVTTSGTGAFTFVAMQPDTYSIRIEHSGFKTYQQTGLLLTANGHIDLDNINLQVGAVTETVSVTAQATAVQNDSSERSAELTTKQLDNLTTR